MNTNASLGLAGETVVVQAGKCHPRVFVDVEQRPGGWYGSFGFNVGNVSGLDTWHGPYGTRLAAITNATFFGLDMLRSRLGLGRGKGVDRTVRGWLSGFGVVKPAQLVQGEFAL